MATTASPPNVMITAPPRVGGVKTKNGAPSSYVARKQPYGTGKGDPFSQIRVPTNVNEMMRPKKFIAHAQGNKSGGKQKPALQPKPKIAKSKKKPGEDIKKKMKHLMSTFHLNKLVLPVAQVKLFVQKILQETDEMINKMEKKNIHMRWSESARIFAHREIELDIIQALQQAHIITLHSKKKTIEARDLECAEAVVSHVSSQHCSDPNGKYSKKVTLRGKSPENPSRMVNKRSCNAYVSDDENDNNNSSDEDDEDDDDDDVDYETPDDEEEADEEEADEEEEDNEDNYASMSDGEEANEDDADEDDADEDDANEDDATEDDANENNEDATDNED